MISGQGSIIINVDFNKRGIEIRNPKICFAVDADPYYIRKLLYVFINALTERKNKKLHQDERIYYFECWHSLYAKNHEPAKITVRQLSEEEFVLFVNDCPVTRPFYNLAIELIKDLTKFDDLSGLMYVHFPSADDKAKKIALNDEALIIQHLTYKLYEEIERFADEVDIKKADRPKLTKMQISKLEEYKKISIDNLIMIE